MEPDEPAEMIQDLEEEREESKKREVKEEAKDKFRSRAAVWIAILAACMAIRGLGGEDAKDEMISKNIETSDAWAHYQAKDVRQATYKVAADDLAAEIKFSGWTGDRLADAQKRLKKLQDSVQHYETDPTAKGAGAGGKIQLKAEATELQEQRERYEHKNKSFDYSEMFYQLGLVLASVSILITSRKLLITSMILGVIGALLTANGFLLFLPPIFG
jgi:hypothetical protein